MRKYNGYEIDENMELVGKAQFVIFGEMSDGTKCYHKVVNGIENERIWYSCRRLNGRVFFFLEGED